MTLHQTKQLIDLGGYVPLNQSEKSTRHTSATLVTTRPIPYLHQTMDSMAPITRDLPNDLRDLHLRITCSYFIIGGGKIPVQATQPWKNNLVFFLFVPNLNLNRKQRAQCYFYPNLLSGTNYYRVANIGLTAHVINLC